MVKDKTHASKMKQIATGEIRLHLFFYKINPTIDKSPIISIIENQIKVPTRILISVSENTGKIYSYS